MADKKTRVSEIKSWVERAREERTTQELKALQSRAPLIDQEIYDLNDELQTNVGKLSKKDLGKINRQLDQLNLLKERTEAQARLQEELRNRNVANDFNSEYLRGVKDKAMRSEVHGFAKQFGVQQEAANVAASGRLAAERALEDAKRRQEETRKQHEEIVKRGAARLAAGQGLDQGEPGYADALSQSEQRTRLANRGVAIAERANTYASRYGKDPFTTNRQMDELAETRYREAKPGEKVATRPMIAKEMEEADSFMGAVVRGNKAAKTEQRSLREELGKHSEGSPEYDKITKRLEELDKAIQSNIETFDGLSTHMKDLQKQFENAPPGTGERVLGGIGKGLNWVSNTMPGATALGNAMFVTNPMLQQQNVNSASSLNLGNLNMLAAAGQGDLQANLYMRMNALGGKINAGAGVGTAVETLQDAQAGGTLAGVAAKILQGGMTGGVATKSPWGAAGGAALAAGKSVLEHAGVIASAGSQLATAGAYGTQGAQQMTGLGMAEMQNMAAFQAHLGQRQWDYTMGNAQAGMGTGGSWGQLWREGQNVEGLGRTTTATGYNLFNMPSDLARSAAMGGSDAVGPAEIASRGKSFQNAGFGTVGSYTDARAMLSRFSSDKNLMDSMMHSVNRNAGPQGDFRSVQSMLEGVTRSRGRTQLLFGGDSMEQRMGQYARASRGNDVRSLTRGQIATDSYEQTVAGRVGDFDNPAVASATTEMYYQMFNQTGSPLLYNNVQTMMSKGDGSWQQMMRTNAALKKFGKGGASLDQMPEDLRAQVESNGVFRAFQDAKSGKFKAIPGSIEDAMQDAYFATNMPRNAAMLGINPTRKAYEAALEIDDKHRKWTPDQKAAALNKQMGTEYSGTDFNNITMLDATNAGGAAGPMSHYRNSLASERAKGKFSYGDNRALPGRNMEEKAAADAAQRLSAKTPYGNELVNFVQEIVRVTEDFKKLTNIDAAGFTKAVTTAVSDSLKGAVMNMKVENSKIEIEANEVTVGKKNSGGIGPAHTPGWARER